MIDFRPERLGHCLHLTKDQIQQVIDLGITVEVCPTSNVSTLQCGLLQMLKHLPLLLNGGANLAICCDDTFLYNTNLSLELFEFCKSFGVLESGDIKKLLVRNLNAIFLDDPDFKQHLADEITNKY